MPIFDILAEYYKKCYVLFHQLSISHYHTIRYSFFKAAFRTQPVLYSSIDSNIEVKMSVLRTFFPTKMTIDIISFIEYHFSLILVY